VLPKIVTDYLLSHRQEHLERLFELLRIPSIANKSDGSCQAAAQWLVDYLKRMRFEAEAVGTDGRPNVLGHLKVDERKPTVLIYGHYDVQPPDPLELWDSPPFQPEVRDGWIYARGADDDKGQLFTHLMAVEALQESGELAVNVKVLLEGAEEIGSPDLEPFVAAYRQRLSADVALVSDSPFYARDIPSITYGLRGLTYVEVVLTGPERDLHSGAYGGAVANPINALARMLAQMHDDRGRVTIDGFYDDVVEPTEEETGSWKELGFDEVEFAADLGLKALAGGEKDRPVLQRLWSRPTLDCNGFVGGYTENGIKTVLPARAAAKVSMRLVPRQDPERIAEAFRRFVAGHTPPGIEAEVKIHAKARPLLLDRHSPAMQAASRAYLEAFGRKAVFVRCGASVPVTELIERLLGIEPVLMSFGLPEDRLHSPNERFPLEHLYRGAIASAAFLHDLGAGGE